MTTGEIRTQPIGWASVTTQKGNFGVSNRWHSLDVPEQREPVTEGKRETSMLTVTASSNATHDDAEYDSAHGEAGKHGDAGKSGTHYQAAYGDATQDAAIGDA